ncbi:MAG: HAD family phosphatase [Chloroflexi bacterium]|nr:HAD family phosphatase [Chloroflexota bacterium]
MKAVIWDMDGVIADTASLHFVAWQEVFQKRGVTVTEDDFRETFGLRNDSIIPAVVKYPMPPEEIKAISREKETMFRSIAKGKLKLLPGVIELMVSLQESGWKQAVASSAPLENIQLVLKELHIEKYLAAIISGEDVTVGKPEPQVFLLAAQKLGVEPENCVVIEDAPAGVIAAKRAGMHCIATTISHPRSAFPQADLIVDSLGKMSVVDLEKLLRK